MSELLHYISSQPFFGTLTFGIIAMVIVGSSWCLIGLIMGDAPKKGVEPSYVQLLGGLFSVSVSTTIMFATKSCPNTTWQIILATCGLYFISGIMNFFMLQIMSAAMQKGPNGIIWAIIQSALVFPFIIGVMFFDVKLSVVRVLGIIFLLVALGLFGVCKDNSINNRGNWRLLAFICLAICAVQQNLMTIPSYFEAARSISSIVRTLSTASGSTLGAIFYVACSARRRSVFGNTLKNRMLWKYVMALQFFNLIFAYTLFYPGMNAMADAGLGGMCYPMLVGSCLVSFTLASIYLLKEKVKPLQVVGLVICISGLVFICTKV